MNIVIPAMKLIVAKMNIIFCARSLLNKCIESIGTILALRAYKLIVFKNSFVLQNCGSVFAFVFESRPSC